jgi:hypothetical protein
MSEEIDTGWEDVRDAAGTIFNVWFVGSELEWAEEAWNHLHAAGLVGGNSPLERTLSAARLVYLGVAYHEFCRLAWDENSSREIPELAEELEFDPVVLGALATAAEQDFLSEHGHCDEDELRASALHVVVHAQRHEVYSCLEDAYGGDVKLYSRMWKTIKALGVEDESFDEFEGNHGNAAALNFVQNGFSC